MGNLIEVKVETHGGKTTIVECLNSHLMDIVSKPSVKRTRVIDWDLSATLKAEAAAGIVREKRGIQIK